MTSRARPLPIVLALALSASCGGVMGPRERAAPRSETATVLEVRAEELRLHFAYANDAAMLGYGGMQLWARPEHDEIHVTAIVDAPSRRARWGRCRDATLENGTRAFALEPRYIGRSMAGGVYDAVRFDIGIHELRELARDGRVVGTICGDRVELSDDHHRALARFVEWFDRIAAPEQEGDGPGFREVGPEIPLLPVEEEDPGPYPA